MIGINEILKKDTAILVAGSSGFIGFNFVNYILNNSKIKIFAYREKSINKSNNFRIEILETNPNFNLVNLNDVENIKVPISYVINFASYGVDSRQKDIQKMTEGNVVFSLKMIDIADLFGAKYIHTSTCYEYEATKNTITELTPLKPDSIYGSFKAATSIIINSVCQSKNVDFVILRLFGVYGPYETGDKLLPYLYKNLSQNEKVSLTDGNQIRDYTFVQDVIKAYLLVAFNNNTETVYNVCSATGISIKDFILKFVEVGGFDTSLLGFGFKEMKENRFTKVLGDNSKFTKEFGWSTTTSIENGMADIFKYFKGKNKVA